MPKRLRSALKSPHAWVCSTNFAEGYPYAIVHEVPKLLFEVLGASLRMIGWTSLLHLAWNLKFLWAPFVDEYETKRRWLITIEALLCLMLVALSVLASGGTTLVGIAVVFTIIALLSATHDVAIDGFYLEAFDEAGQAKFVGYRAMAWKGAASLVKGPGVILIGVIGWLGGLLSMALLMGMLVLIHFYIVPRVEKPRQPIVQLGRMLLRFRVLVGVAVLAGVVVAERKLMILGTLWKRVPALSKISVPGWIALSLLFSLLVVLVFLEPIKRRLKRGKSHYASAFVDFLAQPKIGRILAFVILFRTGESFLQTIRVPFLKRAMKMDIVEYGIANGTVGIAATMVATLLGGWLISRHGLRKWIWPFMLAQNVLNLLYVWLAQYGADVPPSFTVLSIVIGLEHFGEGLGTAVFLVYIMRCCDPAHKAAHMGVLTALMSISFTIAGVTSGYIAETYGYANYFAFSFAVSIPAMLLILVVPYLDGREPDGREATPS
jgi:PAT family beta-lactamase induction signal transducer AmpG